MSSSKSKDGKVPVVLPIKYGLLCNIAREILNTDHWPEINKDDFLKQVILKP